MLHKKNTILWSKKNKILASRMGIYGGVIYYRFYSMKKGTSPRRQDYDYRSWGTYFITICTKDRVHYFGDIVDTAMYLSPIGIICDEEIHHTIDKRSSVDLHEYIIMPNHIHLLIIVGTGLSLSDTIQKKDNENVVPTVGLSPYPKQSLGSVIWCLKSAISRQCNEQWLLFAWQGRYHDHIVRNETEYNRIMYYIKMNPSSRENDMYGK